MGLLTDKTYFKEDVIQVDEDTDELKDTESDNVIGE